MANIYPPTYPQHHPLDFHPRPVTHSPSPLTFGFGLAAAAAAQSSSAFFPPAISSHNHQVTPRPQKRRLEVDEDDGRRGDDAMDRSPTPERPKRAPPKRLRIAATEATVKGSDKDTSDGKQTEQASSDVDVGVLLGQYDTHRPSLLTVLNYFV